MSNAPVVAAVDGSDHSLLALEWARTAALRHRTGLVVAHVLPDTAQLYAARRSSLADASQPEKFADPVGERVRGILAAAPELPDEVRYDALEGSVPEALRVAGESALMLVMGSRGRGGFAALLLGSNSRALASSAACPVVVVPHAARSAPAEPSDASAGFRRVRRFRRAGGARPARSGDRGRRTGLRLRGSGRTGDHRPGGLGVRDPMRRRRW